jgi:hypothetical protein
MFRTLIEANIEGEVVLRRQLKTDGDRRFTDLIVQDAVIADMPTFHLRRLGDGSLQTDNIAAHTCIEQPWLPCANPFCWE